MQKSKDLNKNRKKEMKGEIRSKGKIRKDYKGKEVEKK